MIRVIGKDKKHRKRNDRIAAAVLGIVLIGFSAWYLGGGFLDAETMEISDEDYRTGQRRYCRREQYFPLERGALSAFPEVDENMGLDLRGYDASGLDFTGKSALLDRVTFDSSTDFPDNLPDGFSPEEVMEMGKDPGLGIRALHDRGITGEGVNIAVIDQALNPEHEEYAENVMSYELLHCIDDSAQMHGSAVTSIAVGKNCGVAPGAKVYYIASTFGTYRFGKMQMNLKYMAEGIDRILEINTLLPEDEKIRVISISRGFSSEKGADEVRAAIERAKDAGVFVVTTSTKENYGFTLSGLGRKQMADPDEISSYGPGYYWCDAFYGGEMSDASDLLLVPMDARTYASWYDTEGYEFTSSGGLSWSVPWLAGMYALCLQVDRELTPEEFLAEAFETGAAQQVEYRGKRYELGTIICPEKLVEAIR